MQHKQSSASFYAVTAWIIFASTFIALYFLSNKVTAQQPAEVVMQAAIFIILFIIGAALTLCGPTRSLGISLVLIVAISLLAALSVEQGSIISQCNERASLECN